MNTSVIIVAYNSRAYLPDCLDSILRELHAGDEVIVVDNGSSDGTAAFLRAQYPTVRLLEGENVGYAGGNNRGASVAQGKWLVFLNPDTRLQPGALAALLAPLANSSAIGLTTACIVHMRQPDIVNACGNTIHYTGLTYCRGAGRPSAEYAEAGAVDAVSGAAFAVSRTVFAALGGFDEQFFMYVEDTDLSWRARLAGYRCWYVPRAVVEHDYQPSYTPSKAFYLERNRYMMLLKNLQPATFVRLLPGLSLSECVTWGFLLLKGPHYWLVKLRVYRWLWRQRSELRQVYRQVQALRQCSDQAIMAHLTYRLEFQQLAGSALARIAEGLFHPAFWLGRQVLRGGRI